jgi:capsular exopolysaccharide synthesis family protein
MGKSYDMETYKSSMVDNWYIMPAGDIPPNPSELLGSKRMESALQTLREEFDYIVIDLPPVNIVSDALSISGLITGMVLVIREEYTEKKELEHCFRLLKLSNVNVLGCVMNEAKSGSSYYSKYKRYRYYRYYRYYYKNEYKTHTKGKKQ